MTDMRYPERWLNDRRIERLSDPGHRLFVVAMTWSVGNRTDGVITDEDLAWLGTSKRLDTTCSGELTAAGLWIREPDGDSWLMADFEETQTTRAQLEGAAQGRSSDAERKRKSRAGQKERLRHLEALEAAVVEAGGVTAYVTRDVTPDVTPDVTVESTGQDRPGQARPGREECDGHGLRAPVERCVSCDSTFMLLAGRDGRKRCRSHHGSHMAGLPA